MFTQVKYLNKTCFLFPSPFPFSLNSFITHIHMDPLPRTRTSNGSLTCFSRSCSLSPTRNQNRTGPIDGTITLQEWQGWGTASPLPTMVKDAISYLKSLELEIDAQVTFGGNGGRLMGDFKSKGDKKHRATYQVLSESEMKCQFFSARQIACRLLGSRGYLCLKCWLALEDCMCSKVKPCPLWRGIRFWVYMHPKDFLRQNNTGKLLWQFFGVQAATLCLFGIVEHEDLMWNEFKKAGKSKVWCLYPNKSGDPKSVRDYFPYDKPAEDCLSLVLGIPLISLILWTKSKWLFKLSTLLTYGVVDGHRIVTLQITVNRKQSLYFYRGKTAYIRPPLPRLGGSPIRALG